MAVDLERLAEDALAALKAAGFEHAQVSASVSELDELNINHNEPSLLRSTEDHSLSLMGIIDGRKASTALTDLSEDAIAQGVASLLDRARLAPQDDANAVSENQQGHFEQGPATPDGDLMAARVSELLEFRKRETPKMQIEEGGASHRFSKGILLTTGGTRLTRAIGCYSLSVMGTAIDGDRSSSFNYTGGITNDLSQGHASTLFGIGDMLRETERQIETSSFDGNFKGDIILAPTAVGDLLGWLMGQLQDMALISDNSIYRDKVGEMIASQLLKLKSRFDAPGHAAYTADGFVTPPLTLVDRGRLTCLIPGLYGSRKTGIEHRPTTSGWVVEPGKTPKSELIAGIDKGAMVNRLSMGSPGANGDFSGVIKNSFKIEGGSLGAALTETMIAGNMADMLMDIVAVSSEHLDLGGENFPWIRINNLSFS
ncbi:MAG: metallopeptidase TldD-related protein [Proteobacteria bacterium]|nr:metallopeptidase TldD-related protein [Pseudomonadota bacterium]